MVNISLILRHNLLGKMLNHLLVFCINILLVRELGAEISGAFFNELYLVNFFVFLASFGLDYAAIAIIAKFPEAAGLLHRYLIYTALIISVLFFLTLYFLPQKLFSFRQPVAAVLMFGAGSAMLLLFQAFLSAQKRFNVQNFLLIISNAAFAATLIWPSMHSGKYDSIGIQMNYATLLLVQGILMLLFSFERKEASPKIPWIKYLRHGFFIMLSSLVYFAFLRLDNYFIARYCDPTTLSNYVQCGKIGQYFLYFSSAISSTLIPFLSSEAGAGSYRDWRKLISPYIYLLVSVAAAIAIAGGKIFPLLFGPEFGQMQSLMLIFLPGFVSLGVLTLLNAVYISTGNTSKILVGDILALCTLIVADFLIVPNYGAAGAAIVSSICYVLLLCYLLWNFKSLFKAQYPVL